MTKSSKPDLDLAELDTREACNKPFHLELLKPVTDQPLGVFIPVLGKDSDAVQEHVRTTVNTQIRKESFAQQRGKKPAPATVEQGESEQVELLSVAIFGSGEPWYVKDGDKITPGLPYRGQVLDWTVANIRTVLKEQAWIRRQVDEALGNLENFIKA